ncbi:MAG: hypothetical protein PHE49_00875 [bacterium]|nr:hypothetical protein [bacterium]
MRTIGILTLLLPVYVSADIGFHPTGILPGSNTLFSPKTTNSLLNFNLLQTSDTSTKQLASVSMYAKEAMGGFVGGIVGGLIGVGIPVVGLTLLGTIFGRDIYDDPSAGDIRVPIGLYIGAPTGAIIGITKGVMIVGGKLGENGSYRKTLLGTLLGTAIGVLVAGGISFTLDENHSGVTSTIISASVGSIFPIICAVRSYHW